jgi:sialidase-1
MIKIGLIIFFIAVCFEISVGQQRSPVFVGGKDGYSVYRIPAIISQKNVLLAFCEGRVSGRRDFGDIDIVMKRSMDGGETWSHMAIVVNNDSLQAGNPAPVVDLTDPAYPDGRIFLFYNTGNNHEGEVRKGNGFREVWYKTSIDKGISWSGPVNITAQVHRPNQPTANPSYHFTEDWRSYANTPGHGMQFNSGEFRGRIFIAANHSAGAPQSEFQDYAAHGFFTDDHGKTFRLGQVVGIAGSNESTATELSRGRLMMNSRNQRGDIRARIISISSSGGTKWDTTYFENNLPDPICEGSLLVIGKRKGMNILAFCNAADVKHRDNLTLNISVDDGATWTRKIVVDKATNENVKDHAAYSDILKINKREIGILYERDQYAQIVFTTVKWK